MTGDLIERLEQAEAGSRELDGEVAEATVGFMEWDGTPVTTSLDAALALAERVLPGWAFVLSTGAGDNPAWAQAYPQPVEEDDYQDAVLAGSLPLALCIAILKARTAASSSSPRYCAGRGVR